MTRGRLASLSLAALLVLAAASPGMVSAASFSIFTPYPAVTVQAGNTVTFDLTVTTPSPERVDLAVSGAPSGWTATITGGGNTVDAVYTGGTTPPSVSSRSRCRRTRPRAATRSPSARRPRRAPRALPITIQVETASAGGVQPTTSFAKLSGTATSTFTYSVTLANNGTQQQTFTLQGQGPAGWQVDVHPSSNAQALTDTIAGGSNDTLTVTVTPPARSPPGSTPSRSPRRPDRSRRRSSSRRTSPDRRP